MKNSLEKRSEGRVCHEDNYKGYRFSTISKEKGYEWCKRRVRKWRWCQYCKRTIYKGEYAFSLKGFHAYSICKKCHSSHIEGIELSVRCKGMILPRCGLATFLAEGPYGKGGEESK